MPRNAISEFHRPQMLRLDLILKFMECTTEKSRSHAQPAAATPRCYRHLIPCSREPCRHHADDDDAPTSAPHARKGNAADVMERSAVTLFCGIFAHAAMLEGSRVSMHDAEVAALRSIDAPVISPPLGTKNEKRQPAAMSKKPSR